MRKIIGRGFPIKLIKTFTFCVSEIVLFQNFPLFLVRRIQCKQRKCLGNFSRFLYHVVHSKPLANSMAKVPSVCMQINEKKFQAVASNFLIVRPAVLFNNINYLYFQ